MTAHSNLPSMFEEPGSLLRAEGDGRGGLRIGSIAAEPPDEDRFWSALEELLERTLGGAAAEVPALVRVSPLRGSGPPPRGRLRRLHVKDAEMILLWLPATPPVKGDR